jgi:Co/Zn/Cd efflux system component
MLAAGRMSNAFLNEPLEKTRFHIPQMDCAAEESMIRMRLEGMVAIHTLEFDLARRELVVYHQGDANSIAEAIRQLKMQPAMIAQASVAADVPAGAAIEKKTLWVVLLINALFFLIEAAAGWLAHSMALLADSLDMLADALVYGLSLYAVGGSLAIKKKVARFSGYFQLSLALIGFVEVLRRVFGYEELADFRSMMLVSFLALLANAYCLYLLQRSRSTEVHMQASMIFTSNDIIINLGVVLAGVAVYLTASNLPDLLIGGLVFLLVSRGAFRILRLGR